MVASPEHLHDLHTYIWTAETITNSVQGQIYLPTNLNIPVIWNSIVSIHFAHEHMYIALHDICFGVGHTLPHCLFCGKVGEEKGECI